MKTFVSSQAYIFLCSVIGGIIIAFIYDSFRIIRKAFKTGNLVTYIEDFIFWVLVAVIMFATVYYSNEGELRSYIFLGSILGTILYVLLVSRYVMNSSLAIIAVATKIIRIIYFIVALPFKLVYKVLGIPARAASRFAGRSIKNIRRAGKNRLSKAAIWKRALKNIRKKI